MDVIADDSPMLFVLFVEANGGLYCLMFERLALYPMPVHALIQAATKSLWLCWCTTGCVVSHDVLVGRMRKLRMTPPRQLVSAPTASLTMLEGGETTGCEVRNCRLRCDGHSSG